MKKNYIILFTAVIIISGIILLPIINTIIISSNNTGSGDSFIEISRISLDSHYVVNNLYTNISDIDQFECEFIKESILRFENDLDLEKELIEIDNTEVVCYRNFIKDLIHKSAFKFNSTYYSISLIVS